MIYRLARFMMVMMLGTVCVVSVAAPRVFPQNSTQVSLEAVNDPYLTVDGEQVQMSQGVLIFGQTNSTLVRGALQAGVWVRIQFDPQCLVRRIWVLNSDEIVAVPIWQGIFTAGFVPPTCTGQ